MKKNYICPMAVSVKLHELCQVTVISGQADEDSMGRRFDGDSDTPSTWEENNTGVNIWQ